MSWLGVSNQVCEPSSRGEGIVGGTGRVVSDSSGRWLNVVFDLNGILCSTKPSWQSKGRRNADKLVHSATLPFDIGPKLVWVRPGCVEFLSQLSSFATITVWSSMLKDTAQKICDYLFGPLHLSTPIRVLGQGDCDRVPVRRDGPRTVYMKEEGSQKDIFLKTLSTHLFDKYDGQYTRENTLIIDDSPIKHMLNLKENVLLLPSWSHTDENSARDRILLEKVLPYLSGLHRSSGRLAEYRSCNPELGRPMFYDDRETSSKYVAILKAITDWEARAARIRCS